MIRSAHIDTFTRDNLPRTDLWPEMINIPSYPERINASVELLDRTIELVGAEKFARDFLRSFAQPSEISSELL